MAIALNITEIIILQLGAIILGVSIHFFFVSRKSLNATIATEKRLFTSPITVTTVTSDTREKQTTNLQQRFQNVIGKRNTLQENSTISPVKNKSAFKEDTVESFKESVLQQQKSLNSFLYNIENIRSEENSSLQKEIDQLETLLQKKDSELQSVKQQAAIAQKMAARIEELYKEFDLLQEKIAELEQQARQATNLAIELEDAKQSYKHLEKDLLRKQEKLEQVIAENQQLHEQLNETEDKLEEANLQRQQLSKKTQLLQEMNNDMQHLSDGNKKLQTELRRIGELESMLNIMQEERSHLLNRQLK